MTPNHRSKKTIAAFALAVAAPFMMAAPATAAGTPIKDPVLRMFHNLYTNTYNGFANKFNSILTLHNQALQTKNPAMIAGTQAVMDEAGTLANRCRATIPAANQAFETFDQRTRPLAKPEEVNKLDAILVPFYNHCNSSLLPNVQITASGQVVSDLKFNVRELDRQREGALKKFPPYLSDLLDQRERAILNNSDIHAYRLRERYNDLNSTFKYCLKLSKDYQAALRDGETSQIRRYKSEFEYRCVLR